MIIRRLQPKSLIVAGFGTPKKSPFATLRVTTEAKVTFLRYCNNKHPLALGSTERCLLVAQLKVACEDFELVLRSITI